MGRALSYLPDVVAAAVAVAASLILLSMPDAAFAAALAGLAAVIAAVDRRFFVIPDSAGLALLAGGLALAVRDLPTAAWAPTLGEAVARGLAAGLLLWSLRALHMAWRGAEGLGLGDVKLAAAGAPWLAWTTLVPVLELAVVAALIAVVIEARLARERPRLDLMVPFGVFLAPALWLGFLAERGGFLDRFWPFAGG